MERIGESITCYECDGVGMVIGNKDERGISSIQRCNRCHGPGVINIDVERVNRMLEQRVCGKRNQKQSDLQHMLENGDL